LTLSRAPPALVDACRSPRGSAQFAKPMDVLADQLRSTHNALYKVLFDARKKLRFAQVASDYLPEAAEVRAA
jgi:hypothetical protein